MHNGVLVTCYAFELEHFWIVWMYASGKEPTYAFGKGKQNLEGVSANYLSTTFKEQLRFVTVWLYLLVIAPMARY